MSRKISETIQVGDYVMTESPKEYQSIAMYTLGIVTRVVGSQLMDLLIPTTRTVQLNVDRDDIIQLKSVGAQGKHCDIFENASRRVYWDGEMFQESAEACDKTFWNPSQVDRTQVKQVKDVIAGLKVKEMRDLFLSKGWPIRDSNQHLLSLFNMKQFYQSKMLEDVPMTLERCATAAKGAKQSCANIDTECENLKYTCARIPSEWYQPWNFSKKKACKQQVEKCRAKTDECRLTSAMPKHAAALQQKLREALQCYDSQQLPNSSTTKKCTMTLDDIKQETNFVNSTCVGPFNLAANQYNKYANSLKKQ